mgnify:CR=1 FL=1
MPLYALIIPRFRRIVFPEANRYIVDEGIEILSIQIVAEMMNYLINFGSSAFRATEGVLWFRYHLLTL